MTWPEHRRAALRKNVPNVLSCCHTKIRTGARGRARPSFGMTPTFHRPSFGMTTTQDIWDLFAKRSPDSSDLFHSGPGKFNLDFRANQSSLSMYSSYLEVLTETH